MTQSLGNMIVKYRLLCDGSKALTVCLSFPW